MPVVFSAFAGSAACKTCHEDIYMQHQFTEHNQTSALAKSENIRGSFSKGKNRFEFDAANEVVMEKRDSGMYQVHYVNQQEVQKARFDIVVGSGRKGQSYLEWTNDHLNQMPITYFTPAAQWSNSPGYPPARVVFNRPITARCLECHSTYFEKTSSVSNAETFDHDKIIFGVACEKCHGPAADHVAFQTKNPGEKNAKFIVNPAKLSRERVLDLCGLCHGGQLKKTKPSFQFGAGDTLANYFTRPMGPPSAAGIDVHGNQLGLLEQSKCYQLSNLTCGNCHDAHKMEKDRLALFSSRCQTCHDGQHKPLCKLTKTIGPAIVENCIDCHMPRQPSHAIAVYLQGATSPTPALLRTHFITTYPEETKKYLAQQKKKSTR